MLLTHEIAKQSFTGVAVERDHLVEGGAERRKEERKEGGKEGGTKELPSYVQDTFLKIPVISDLTLLLIPKVY